MAALAHNVEIFQHLTSVSDDKYRVLDVCSGENTALHLALRAEGKGLKEKDEFIDAVWPRYDDVKYSAFMRVYNNSRDSRIDAPGMTPRMLLEDVRARRRGEDERGISVV